MSATLKPCPFCGSHLELSEAFSTRTNQVYVHPVTDPLCVAQFVVGTTDKHRIAAWNRRADGWQEIGSDAIEYVSRYGGFCRDCADENGTCPSNGLPCDFEDRKKATAHVILALNYGHEHGYLQPPAEAS